MWQLAIWLCLRPAVDLVLLQRIVPENIQEMPHAFESVGHIAHMNLRDELLPYKHIIGQVTLSSTHLLHPPHIGKYLAWTDFFLGNVL